MFYSIFAVNAAINARCEVAGKESIDSDQNMHRLRLLQNGSDWRYTALPIIVAVMLAPRVPAATVISGDIVPSLPWDATTAARIGASGDGTLTVDGGSQLISNSGTLGSSVGSTGTATITGTGATWTNNSELRVGLSGQGALQVGAGGQVSDTGGYLGYNAGSTGIATVTGAGAKWNSSSYLTVGRSGSGTLHVESGGQVNSYSGKVGFQSGSNGTATITGAGSSWNNDIWLYIGDAGSGELNVEAGGLVTNVAGFLGNAPNSIGTAKITGVGSSWANDGDLYVGRSGSGELRVELGALVSVRGTLTIDFNGDGDSSVSLSTGGMLALWGDADDSPLQFLDLVAGTDLIRYWDADLVEWVPLTAGTLGIDYHLQYQDIGDLAGFTLLTVGTLPHPGDFNFDGDVDGADFLAWQRGSSPTPNSPEDLALWRANFGVDSATPGTAAVPEPSTIALAGLVLTTLLRRCLINRRCSTIH